MPDWCRKLAKKFKLKIGSAKKFVKLFKKMKISVQDFCFYWSELLKAQSKA